MVSLPIGEKERPKTMFMWVCCRCGRSHVSRARKAHWSNNVAKEENQKDDFARRLLHMAKKKLTHKSEEREADGKVAKEYSMEERRSFKVAFRKECKCGRLACDSCLKFKVAADGSAGGESGGAAEVCGCYGSGGDRVL
jgi:hypothetical protein